MTILELYEVRNLRDELKREIERQRSLEAAIDGLTVTLDGLPRPPNHTSRTERLAVLLVDTSEIIRELNERIITAAVNLTEKIFAAELTDYERKILQLRYVKGLSFNAIAAEVNLSRSYMFRIHSDALKKATRNGLE